MNNGIVTSCGKSEIHFLNLNILLNSIQYWGLSIEIFHQNEIKKEKQQQIKKKYNNVSFINLDFIKDNLRGYQMKPFAMYFSKFDNLLWIDNDIVPILPFNFLFNSNYDAIFWKDKYMHSSEIIRHEYNFKYEYETGVIFIKKKKIIKELQKTLIMNSNHKLEFNNNSIQIKNFNGNRDKYYKQLLGDKDTFQIAFQNYKNKYVNPEIPIGIGTKFYIYQIPYTDIIIKFPFVKGNFYETGLVQKYKGNNLFLHKTVYENKLGEIFYYLYDTFENESSLNSSLNTIEDVSIDINKELVSHKYYFYIIYFLLYIGNLICSLY